MSIRAFVLIQTEVGRASEIRSALEGIDGVESADGVTGPYDLIALVAAPSLEALGRLIIDEIQDLEGISRTVTCPITSA